MNTASPYTHHHGDDPVDVWFNVELVTPSTVHLHLACPHRQLKHPQQPRKHLEVTGNNTWI